MPSTAVFSFRLPGERAQSLRRLARRLRRSAGEIAAQFVDEATRQAEFASIEFRDSALGRQAYIRGSRLAVWQVVKLADAYHGNIEKTAEHLRWPASRVKAALNYSQAFQEEIGQAIEDARSISAEKLLHLLPSLEVVEVPAAVRRG